eukprot:jgi/Tetstr1/422283/TSEL_013127.t1
MESLYVLNDCYEAAPAAPQRPAYISPEDGSVYVYPQWARNTEGTMAGKREPGATRGSQSAIHATVGPPSVVAGGAACTSRERSEADHLQDPEKDAAQAKVELQRVKKRESARRRYHLRQQQLLELQATVKESRQNNLELQRDLDKLLSEADDLGKREKELVDAQKLSRDEIQKLKQQKLALKGK